MEAPSIDLLTRATPELRRLIARAVQIGEQAGRALPLRSSRLLLAFLVSDDSVSRWFQGYVAYAYLSPDVALKREGLSPEELKQIRRTPPSEDRLTQDRLQPAGSAESVLLGAQSLLMSPSSEGGGREGLLDARHVMGAFLYSPGEHEKDLLDWKIDPLDWSNDFLTLIDVAYHEEYPIWHNHHLSRYSSPPELKPLMPELGWDLSALSPVARKVVQEARELANNATPGPIPLTTSCLMLAMFDRAMDRPIGFDVAELLIAAVGRDAKSNIERLKQEYLGPSSGEDYQVKIAPRIPPGEAVTRQVWGALERAKRMARSADPSARTEPRHLLAGLMTYDPERPEGSPEGLLELLDMDVPSFRARVTDFVEDFVWDRLVGYNADRVGDAQRDVLNIDQQVNPLAALIAAHATQPPLAIGVFGEWGSGKTFFMDRLRKRIDRIASAARASGLPQSRLPFFKQIVQIEFNAWHYVESNLWASLTEHLFAELKLSGRNISQEQERQDQREVLKKEIEGLERAKAEAEGKLKTAQDDLQTARKKLMVAREEADQGILPVAENLDAKELPMLNEEVKGLLTQLGLAAAAADAKGFHAALSGARAALQRRSFLLYSSLRGSRRQKLLRLLYLALILVSAPAVAFAIAALVTWLRGTEVVAQVSGFVGGLAAFVGAAVAWVQRESERASRLLAGVEQASRQLETTMQAKRAAQLKGVVEDVEQENAKLAAARAAYEGMIQEVEEKRAALRALEPEQVLAQLIRERADCEDYRKYLGIMALVRRDFDSLSLDVQNLNRKLLDVSNPEGSRIEESGKVINRIVLYIDDLDRCPPPRVIQVLQAIHLLMAFPLFVVVVGVDARWISGSLVHHYSRMLRDGESDGSAEGGDGHFQPPAEFGREATPHDYLEKIFQIPLWLDRIGAEGARGMVDALVDESSIKGPKETTPSLGRSAGDSGSETKGAEAQSEQAKEQPRPSDAAGKGNGAEDAGQSRGSQGETAPKSEEPPEENTAEEIELVAPQLEILEPEHDFMHQLAPLLTRSPRAVKRFVNLYRLVKAGLKSSELTTFTRPEEFSDCKIVLFLLAIVTNLPDLSRPLFQGIRRGEAEGQTLAWVVENQLSDAPDVDRRMLEAWLGGEGQGWRQAPLKRLEDWVDEVGRFSFRVDRQLSLASARFAPVSSVSIPLSGAPMTQRGA